MLDTQISRVSPSKSKLFNYSAAPLLETSVFNKALHHRSLILYTVPSERLRALIPEEFELAAKSILTVESFLDQSRLGFEQTNYRVQVKLQGDDCHWLLGTSLGSLSGVATRHLYQMPWHLSAMEFQMAFDEKSGRYHHYRLQTQSQWANAAWEIADLGTIAESSAEITDYFIRRDGVIGNYQTFYQPAMTTRGVLKYGRCDVLNTLDILTAPEINSPTSVILQRSVSSTIKPQVKVSYRLR